MDKSDKSAHRQPKAYQDTRFLESKDARALRILAEYMEPLYRFQRNNVQDTIVFMGSARLLSEEAAKTALAEAQRAGQGIEAAKVRAIGPPDVSAGVQNRTALADIAVKCSEKTARGPTTAAGILAPCRRRPRNNSKSIG